MNITDRLDRMEAWLQSQPHVYLRLTFFAASAWFSLGFVIGRS